MRLLLVSVAVVFTSLCYLTDQAACSRVKAADPWEQRTYLSEYYSLGQRLRDFSERVRTALREFFADLNLSNFGEKIRRFNEQLRDAFQNLFFS